MGSVFSITLDEYIFDVLVEHIFFTYSEKEISELQIILPCNRDVTALLNAFKIRKCLIIPDIISLENIDEEKATNLYEVQIINPVQQVLLLIEFILKWNEENNDNYPIDLAYSLSPLLNTEDPIKHSKQTVNFMESLIKSWNNTLRGLGMMDKLEHRKHYINNMILSLCDTKHIIFVGVAKEEIYQSLIKAIYKLPYGVIILPNVNFKIPEKNWKSLNVKHYQYIIKNFLDTINISRNEIHHLGKQPNKIIDYIFDTTNQPNIQQDNIEIITFNSLEEEAREIESIVRNEGSNNVSLFINNQLLAIRVACLLKQYDVENYLHITLLLYSAALLASNWNSVDLLSLLKHPLVEFGYTEEKYFEILTEFEIEILRNSNTNSLTEIIDAINKHKKIKYKEYILMIINKLQIILDPLLHIIHNPIQEVIKVHLQCFSYLSFNNNTITNFVNACKHVKIKCSLELYSKILSLFFRHNFFSITDNKPGLYNTRVVILSHIQEGQNYFLYNLFCANKVYITSHKQSILEKRIAMFCHTGIHNYSNIVTHIVPCTQPTPKPSAQVRKEKMQVMSCRAVETLIRNPYTFYVEYILNIRKLKGLNTKSSVLEFGTIVHEILAKHLFNISLKEFPHHFSSMWWIRLQKIIHSFIKVIKTRSKHIEAEKIFTFQISQETSMNARCDRVEYLTDDSVAVIDYKLGSQNKVSGFFPQLILQALAVESTTKKKVSELAYWQFDYGQAKIILISDYRKKMQEFQNILPQFLSNYLNSDIPFTASPYLNKFLRFNDYTHLERTKEWL